MTGQERNPETKITERAREVFDRSVREIDAQTRSRLAQARASAVDAAESRRFRWTLTPSQLVPAGALAAAVLAVAVIWQPGLDRSASVEANVLTDLDILLEGENLDLFEELDFYAWLLEQPELLEGAELSDGSG